MRTKLARTFLALLLALALAPAHATFHLWRITEIYSNADGSVQFIELIALASGQQFIAGHTITASQGGQTRSYTFPTHLPGDSAMSMGGGGYYGGGEIEYKYFLIGTTGFAALNVVRPDYVIPNGFLFSGNGQVNFAEGSDVWTYSNLPSTGGLSLQRNGASAMNSPTNFDGMSGTVAASSTGPANYSDMWWAGPAENGWGMSIQQHGNTQFNAIYAYDAAGKPSWYVMPGGTWSADFLTYSGPVYQPTSAPLDNYTPSLFVPGASPGTVSIRFTGGSTAVMSYTIAGVSGQKSLGRQEFGGGTAPFTVGDMWWAGATQDGWGINIVQHDGILFAVWYTYAADGKGTWFVLPNGTWSGNTYSGPLYATTGSPWLGAAYNASQLVVTQVGALSLSFTDANAAMMSYTFTSGPFAGTAQSRSIVRQPY
jgi:hypothetical protein